MVKIVVLTIVLFAVVTLIHADINVNVEDKDSGDWLKSIGSSLQSGADKIQEGAKKLGEEISDGAKKFSENAKQFGHNVQTKFSEWKDKATADDDVPKMEPSLLGKLQQ